MIPVMLVDLLFNGNIRELPDGKPLIQDGKQRFSIV